MAPEDYIALATDHVAACPACDSPERSPVADFERAGFPATSHVCTRCGLVYLSPRMTTEGYAAFYRDGTYRRVTNRFSNSDNPAAVRAAAQQVYAAGISVKLREWLEPRAGQSLVDIGGSTGATAERLWKDHGLRCTVLEPSDDERSEAEAKGLQTIAGTLDDWRPSERYDVVTMCQTVDHLTNPYRSLLKIRQQVVNDDGLFIVDVVDFRYLAIHFCDLTRAVKVDHPCAFAAFTFERLLERTGFKVVGTARWNDVAMLDWGEGQRCIPRKMLYVCWPCGEFINRRPHDKDMVILRALIDGLRRRKEEQACQLS